ncbi:MAG: 2,3-bisphosphoglycerate-independent phosphoglycerate mutase [Gammaproteobacteria bacterium]|nr:2,3-bisphosphoglycerate-independent phosphoglycerate mutase [Gammaproteobacteria bacterium]
MKNKPRPVALLIMDGWGYRENKEDNAIATAATPNWDKLWREQATTVIDTSGINVGLPKGQMGNSEVGHLNLGWGRVVYQEYTRISAAIEDGSFFDNDTLVTAIDAAVADNRAVHLMGLLSPGGVHSHEDHIVAACELAESRGARRIYLHAMLDGRDMPPQSAAASIEKLERTFTRLEVGRIATLCGRYYAMDRDNRWDRIQKAYDLYTLGTADYEAASPLEALQAAYERGENDEFVAPVRIAAPACIDDGDAVLFLNFRADRARQITRAFIEPDFTGFERAVVPQLQSFVCMTQYHADFDVPVAFPPAALTNVLGEFLANAGLTQLRIAETEKYAHVTFFFNGGREEPFNGEERVLVPSPRVATYDLQPEMNAPIVTDKLIDAIEQDQFDVIICNFANADMVGHTGNFDAAVKAIEALDKCIGRIAQALQDAGGEMLVTADHGNAEKMRDADTGQAHTAHTTCKVPLVYMGRKAVLAEGGTLSDIAPTLLHIMDLQPPEEMTGRCLITFADASAKSA